MNYPTTDEFDHDTAKELLENGGTLIVENFPSGCEFGIDLSVNYTANKFMGFKLIPPGIHFVYFSYVKQENSSPRIGFFMCFQPKQVVCLTWNDSNEDLQDCSSEQTERLTEAFHRHELDSSLGLSILCSLLFQTSNLVVFRSISILEISDMGIIKRLHITRNSAKNQSKMWKNILRLTACLCFGRITNITKMRCTRPARYGNITGMSVTVCGKHSIKIHHSEPIISKTDL